MRIGRKLTKVSLPAIAFAVLLGLTTCSNPVSEILNSRSLGMVGTWINTNPALSMYGSLPAPYKIVVRNDGTFATSDSTGTMASSSGTYAISSVSLSGDTRTYTIDFYWTSASPIHAYALVRIVGVTTWESNTYSNPMTPGYPPAINPSDTMTYSKHTLQ
jgi:hypothetical protein